MSNKLAGAIIPAITSFTETEAIDFAAIQHNFACWNQTSVTGYMVLGTNGEFKSLTDSESKAVVIEAAKACGEKTLIAGIGRESLVHTLRFADSLSGIGGIDYLSVLTPNYFSSRMDAAALTNYYLALADRVFAPILIYVIPGNANGVVLPPAALAELAEHPNIAGIKDTSPAMLTSYFLAAGGRDDFEIMAGSLSNLMTGLAFGGRGGVLSAANYLPEESARVFQLYQDNPASAHSYYRVLAKVAKATGGKRGVASVKAAMNLRDYRAGIPRLPLAAMDPSEIADAMSQGLTELSQWSE